MGTTKVLLKKVIESLKLLAIDWNQEIYSVKLPWKQERLLIAQNMPYENDKNHSYSPTKIK